MFLFSGSYCGGVNVIGAAECLLCRTLHLMSVLSINLISQSAVKTAASQASDDSTNDIFRLALHLHRLRQEAQYSR